MIGRKSLLVIGNSFFGAALGYVAVFAIARFMGPEIYGARQYVLSAIFVVGVATRLGFPITHARRLARGEDVGRSNGAYLLLKVLLTGGLLGLALAAGWLWFDLLGKTAVDTTETALWLALFIVLAQSLRDVAVNTFRGLGQIVEREAVLVTNTVVTVGLTVWVAIAYAHGAGRWSPVPGLSSALAGALGVDGAMGFQRAVTLLMGAYLAGDVVALILSWGLFLRNRIPVLLPTRSIVRDYVRATLPLMVLSVAAVLATRVSHLLLGFWWDAGELGQYAAALKLNDVLLLIGNGVTIALLPAVAALDLSGEHGRLRTLMIQTERWVSMLVWPAVVVVVLEPKAILHVLLSDAFLPAAPVLVILAFQALCASLRIPLQTKALGMGHHGFAARLALVALVTDVLLNLVLTPRHLGPIPMLGLGARGAALAALGAGIVTLLAYREKAHGWTGHPYISIHLLRHAGAAAATALVFWAISPWFGLGLDARLWQLAAYAAGVFALYAGILVATRELGRRDLHDLGALLRRSETAK